MDLYIQGLDARNFPKESYDLQAILMHETVDSLVASIRAEARALNGTQLRNWYVMCLVSKCLRVTLAHTSYAIDTMAGTVMQKKRILC